MPPDLPSLRRFQPSFHCGGVERYYLAVYYDLFLLTKPRLVVTAGFGDGQAHFTFCQAARDSDHASRLLAFRGIDNGSPEDDEAWQKGLGYNREFYGDFAELLEKSPARAADEVEDGSVDLLLLDDCDSYAAVRSQLDVWGSKLSPHAVLLIHGIGTVREAGLRQFWDEATAEPRVEFSLGIGLGLTLNEGSVSPAHPLAYLFGGPESFANTEALYAVIADRIDARACAETLARENRTFRLRQIWFDSVLDDRWKAQEVMDHQAREIGTLQGATDQANALREMRERELGEARELGERFDALHRDRVKAQLVMDTQAEQLKHWVATCDVLRGERDQATKRAKEQKKMIDAAKRNCRKDGRCFRLPGKADPARPKLSVPEKILREIRRVPANLFGRRQALPTAANIPRIESVPARDPYETWISEHEPDAAALDQQRAQPATAKISLLTPIFDTPAQFLEEMLASVTGQTHANWELCIADAGSKNAETAAVLARWQAREPRIRVQRLARNFGISVNTNEALRMATGDFVGLLDHDDLLAPFGLYEVARAIERAPEADIFYSDEDRWSEEGRRHAPFFKPEWSPELLFSCMYLGHLSVYRRRLVDELGGFRAEFDLSQDYDLALRATERAGKIVHVPHVLYHWREHPASGSAGGKPHARQTNLAALADAVKRRGLPADVLECPTANRVRCQLPGSLKVSIIIPTDSRARAEACLRKLPAATCYGDFEIVLVTNSPLIELLQEQKIPANVRFVAYDEPFNFSAKCNAGAEASDGELLVFYNDDVEPQQADWIENLVEPLQNPGVGAVAPKLLYQSGTIQHAGLVTGVRGLIGTAFHEQPQTATIHFNFAQSMRDVSALSGACLAVRRADFARVGGFDAANTPVSHSDIDLCFKIRDLGQRCVYTPFATLTHVGHVSLGAEEKAPILAPRPKDKSDIFLLKRWAGYTTHDPFYPDNMRDWLFADSPTPIRMFGSNDPGAKATSRDLLFISHDLTLSGAPILLLQLARWCREHNFFATVMAPEDGPLREQYQAAGIPLIIDSLIMREHESFGKFCRNFDCVIGNTIRSWPVVRIARKENVPVLWWLHETMVGEHFLREDAQLRSSLPLADIVFAPSERTAAVYRPFRDGPVERVPYGIPDLAPKWQPSGLDQSQPLRFLVLGSIEPRKGQDVFLDALWKLDSGIRNHAIFQIAGRTMVPEWSAKITRAAAGLETLEWIGAVSHKEALKLLTSCDVLVCASRDEAMPVTLLEAMSLGKAILSTTVGGVAEFVTDGENGMLVRPEEPAEMARALQRLIEDRSLIGRLSEAARRTYEQCFQLDQFGENFRGLVERAIQESPVSV